MPWELASKSLKYDYLPAPITEEFLLKLNVSLGDYGVAYWENRHLHETIQPLLMRVPEVITGAPWNSKAVIWSLGASIVQLLGGFEMFEGDDDHGNYNELKHLHEVNFLFGPFSKKIVSKTSKASRRNRDKPR